MKTPQKLDGHDVHPAAALFEPLKAKDFRQLVDDIKSNGLCQSIKLFNDMILDGVNRARACIEAGVPATYETLPSDTNPWRYVLSANIRRRHLTAGQRSAIAAKLLKKETQAARDASKERQRSGKGPDGSGGRGRKTSGHNEPKVSKTAAEVIAEEANVSASTAKKALVVEDADPDLAQEVVEGTTPLSEAHERVKKTSGHMRRKPSAPPTKDYDPEDEEFVPSSGTPTSELWARLSACISNAKSIVKALRQRDEVFDAGAMEEQLGALDDAVNGAAVP